MKNVYFGEFRAVVIEHIRHIDTTRPEPYSVEWFLLRYLRRIVKSTEPEPDPARVESSVRGLIRFYADNIDRASDAGERCRAVHTAYRRTLRQAQEQQ